MDIPFTKLHGNGNDFILVDEWQGEVIPDEMKPRFAAVYCDRRFGVGADGVLFLSRSDKDNVRMRIFQPDESEAEMCGNGIRCLAKYAYDLGYVVGTCSVETSAGSMAVSMGYNREGEFSATIRMADPAFSREQVPASGMGEFREELFGRTVYAVNTGVPHAVIFVDDLQGIDIESEAPAIRNHPVFLKGANVNFVQLTRENHLSIRTFERGVEAETLSCGTGATASAAVARHLGMVGEVVHVETEGGPLTIMLGEKTSMDGPAETVFAGVIPF